MAQAMEFEGDTPADLLLCTECGEIAGEIRRLKKLFCRTCWIHFCDFRFRKRLYELGKPPKGLSATASSLGSSMQSMDSAGTSTSGRPILPLENVLVDYDAATEHSIALLYLLRDAVVASLEADAATEHPKNLPFPFMFTILVISAGVHENGEINLNKKENIRMKNFERLKSWYKETINMPKLGNFFPSILVTSLEESLEIAKDPSSDFSLVDITQNIDAQLPFPLNYQLHEKLVALVENLRTKTSRIDLLQILRHNLAEAVAVRLNIGKVLIHEDQSSLAVKMFSLMSIGRGAQLADQMNFTSHGDHTLFARPLLDFNSEDLREYMKCIHLLEESKHEQPDAKIDNIKAQCEDFIQTLQRNYPATVPTLTRIGAKLEPTSDQFCRPCSSAQDDSKHPKLNLCSLCRNVKDTDSQPGTHQAESLCYACSRILQEMKTPSLLLEILKQ